jgi:ribosomal protein L37E
MQAVHDGRSKDCVMSQDHRTSDPRAGRWTGLTYEHAEGCKSVTPSVCAIQGCPVEGVRPETPRVPVKCRRCSEYATSYGACNHCGFINDPDPRVEQRSNEARPRYCAHREALASGFCPDCEHNPCCEANRLGSQWHSENCASRAPDPRGESPEPEVEMTLAEYDDWMHRLAFADDEIKALRKALAAIEAYCFHRFQDGEGEHKAECSFVTPDGMRHCGRPFTHHPVANLRTIGVFAQKARAPSDCAGTSTEDEHGRGELQDRVRGVDCTADPDVHHGGSGPGRVDVHGVAVPVDDEAIVDAMYVAATKDLEARPMAPARTAGDVDPVRALDEWWAKARRPGSDPVAEHESDRADVDTNCIASGKLYSSAPSSGLAEAKGRGLLDYLAGDFHQGRFATGMQAVLKYAEMIRHEAKADELAALAGLLRTHIEAEASARRPQRAEALSEVLLLVSRRMGDRSTHPKVKP